MNATDQSLGAGNETPERLPPLHVVDGDDPRNCSECGMSDWDCLDLMNRVNGARCCGLCGLVDVHAATAVELGDQS